MKKSAFSVDEYVDQVALMLDLQLNPEYRQNVVENFARVQAIAQLVNEFPIPEAIEAAPIFEP